MVTASDRSVIKFSLSGGNVHDAPEGEKLLNQFNRQEQNRFILMDRAYEGDNTRAKAIEKGLIPVVPPKKNRKNPWGYDKQRYKQRNEIERYFLRLKRFRKIFTRYDKLDAVFSGFIYFAMIVDALVCVNRLYYFVDVIPQHFIGRFMAFFNVICALVGYIFSTWFLQMEENFSLYLYIGSAIIYMTCIMLMLIFVPEGSYPKVEDTLKKSSLWNNVQIYFRECFSLPFYVFLFIAIAINTASMVCRNLFLVFFAQTNLGLSLDEFGKINGYSQLLTLILVLPLGYLNDRVHPLKIFTAGGFLVVVINLLSYIFIADKSSFIIYTLLLSAAYAVQLASNVPLSAALFPKSHFGQFGSAQAMLVSITMIVANGVGGWFMDLIHDYRYLYLWDFSLTVIALAGLGMVFKMWKNYGGEKNYVAPLNTGNRA